MRGFRRLTIRATAQQDKTLIEVFVTQNTALKTGFMIGGFLLCVIPGLYVLIANIIADRFTNSIVQRIVENIRSIYPNETEVLP